MEVLRLCRRGVLLIVCCGATLVFLPATSLAATTHSVSITSYMFSPDPVTIHVGDKVTWKNNDPPVTGPDHTATSDDGHTFDSGDLQPGSAFSFTFTKAGTFAYHCNVHTFMHGTIKIIGTTTSPSPTPTHTRPKSTATATAKPTVVPVSPTPTSPAKPSPRASKTQTLSATPTPHVSPSASPSRAAAASSSSSKGSGAAFVWAAAALVVVAAAGALLLRARRTHR